jgi:hypothetical protein
VLVRASGAVVTLIVLVVIVSESIARSKETSTVAAIEVSNEGSTTLGRGEVLLAVSTVVSE